jgi:hypothetical protein
LILVTLGEYFSAKFFVAKIAKDLFIKKKKSKQQNTIEADHFEGGSLGKKNFLEDIDKEHELVDLKSKK